MSELRRVRDNHGRLLCPALNAGYLESAGWDGTVVCLWHDTEKYRVQVIRLGYAPVAAYDVAFTDITAARARYAQKKREYLR